VEDGVTAVPDHPAEFSPEILDVVEPWLSPGEHVHDPFGGRGLRLGALCDRIGATFTATDIETYRDRDQRVARGDSKDSSTYPLKPFTTVTSPVYLNGISSDYKDGPTPTTKTKGRRSYGISLGGALHPRNLARTVVRSRPDKGASDYYLGHADVVKHWSDRAVVNIDEPMGDDWCWLLEEHGYRIAQVIPVFTQRYGGLDNAEVRADHEVVIIAARGATWTPRTRPAQLALFEAAP
jgi:hypothetical protein